MNVSNSGEKRPTKTEHFVETEVDGERVIMQIENGYFFTMNPSAEAVWSNIDGVADQDEIVKVVAQHFEISEETCKTDILEFIGELQDNNLVVID